VRTALRLCAILVTIGVVAFLGGHLRASGGKGKASNPPLDEPRANQSFDRKARLVAEKFILTAVARKNTGASWKLVDLSFPGRSELTKREWATGDIPVMPTSAPITKNAIRLSVAEVHAHGSELLLDVVLGPNRKRPEVFEIGLRRHGKGAERRWLVDYWWTRYRAPHGFA
jgi:hypothetical protein